ncbi:hypothetical protein [Anaerolinea sp.]|uniref:hypothetical protein n=1 Tax=Anaerolinea sp. TaxID=1872519 RepID=UPI002ACE1812|nr:hypothetical protein [Anaerolinea sp.]
MPNIYLYLEYVEEKNFVFYWSQEKPTQAWEDDVLELKFEGSPASFQEAGKRLALWLASLENKTAEKGFPFQFAFYQLFQDQRYRSSKSYEPAKIFQQAPNTGKDIEYSDFEKQLLRLVLCRGMFLYLIEEERYRKLDAFLICAYTGWQWYNLLKQLLLEESRRNDPDWLNEMGTAFRHLSALLVNENFSQHGTWYQLFDQHRSSLHTDDLQYRLWIESICVQKESSNSPRITPEIFDKNILWDTLKKGQYAVNLHPIFHSHGPASAVVRHLASNIFLRDYDFETAYRLANLLGKRRLNLRKVPLGISLLIVLIFTALSAIGITAGMLMVKMHGSVYLGLDKMILPILAEWIIVGIPIFILIREYFDLRVLPRLLLPRLAGGILIGFLALSTQEDSVKLSDILWSQGYFLPALLWLAVTAVSVFYLYGDIRPLVKDNHEVVNRIFQSVMIFIVFSLGMGLFITPFPTTAFSPPPPHSNWFLGPTGWVDIKVWLTYSPLALFIGLMTQFLFEEKSITSPVWQMEKE